MNENSIGNSQLIITIAKSATTIKRTVEYIFVSIYITPLTIFNYYFFIIADGVAIISKFSVLKRVLFCISFI